VIYVTLPALSGLICLTGSCKDQERGDESLDLQSAPRDSEGQLMKLVAVSPIAPAAIQKQN
jgi:hypothetical protein